MTPKIKALNLLLNLVSLRLPGNYGAYSFFGGRLVYWRGSTPRFGRQGQMIGKPLCLGRFSLYKDGQ